MSHSSTAAELLATSDVWDMTLPWLPVYWDMDVLARYHRAGYTYVSLTLQNWPPTLEGTQRCIDQFKRLAAEHSAWLGFAETLAEIDRGRAQNKLMLGVNSQETRPIGEDLSRIQSLYDMGVRHMVLAYNVRNLIADGCAESADAGLSNFGRQVVREMNRVGMIVDCAHTGRRSSLEAIELSERPVIFSHSNPRAVCGHLRNIHDEQIQACAARGGVVGIVGVGAFLGDREARTDTMFRHIDYVASLVGCAHVGLGTDFVNIFPVEDHLDAWQVPDPDTQSWPNAAYAWPDQASAEIPVEDSHCFRPEQLLDLVETMLAHGYAHEDIKGVLGGNFRRVYSAAR